MASTWGLNNTDAVAIILGLSSAVRQYFGLSDRYVTKHEDLPK